MGNQLQCLNYKWDPECKQARNCHCNQHQISSQLFKINVHLNYWQVDEVNYNITSIKYDIQMYFEYF